MKTFSKILFLTILVTSILFSGCRKGEDDPFFSFRSRTTRLTGDWELTKASFKTEEYETKRISTSYEYSSGKLKVTVEDEAYGTLIGEQSYTENYSFDEDGTYSSLVTSGDDRYSTKGNWIWIRDNEDIDLEDEEAIVMTITTDYNGNIFSGRTNLPSAVWVFNRLSNDEIIVELDSKSVYQNGEYYSITGTFTYKQ